MIARTALVAAASLAAACGSGTSIQGNAGQLTFDMSKATMVNSAFSVESTSGATFLVLSTDGDMCRVVSDRTVLQNAEAIIVEIALSPEIGEVTFPSVAGSYTIGGIGDYVGDKSANVTALGTGSCLSTSVIDTASSGTLTLSHVEVDGDGVPQRLVGTLDARFADGEVTGSFDATLCDPQVETGFNFQIFLCQ